MKVGIVCFSKMICAKHHYMSFMFVGSCILLQKTCTYSHTKELSVIYQLSYLALFQVGCCPPKREHLGIIGAGFTFLMPFCCAANSVTALNGT